MEDQPYKEPRLTLGKIYTRTGDRGETRLASGERVPKDSPRLDCYGTIDELNSYVGMARHSAGELASAAPALSAIVESLIRIQHELFNLGSILATSAGKAGPQQPRVDGNDVEELEREIDLMNGSLPPLKSFVLPGGSRINTELHVCRTVCRRAERMLISLARVEEIDEVNIRYINRLSDMFFVMSRWVNVTLGVPEVLWSPNQAASGKRV